MLRTPTSNPNPGAVVAARAAYPTIAAFAASTGCTGHKPGPRRHPATTG